MRAAGVNRLSGTKGLPAASLLDMFPDQNIWLQKFYADLRTSCARHSKQSQLSKQHRRSKHAQPAARREFTAQALAENAGYCGPIELLAMDLCLAGDCSLSSFPPHYLRDHLKLAIQLSQPYYTTNGLCPHPAVICQMLRDELAKPTSSKRSLASSPGSRLCHRVKKATKSLRLLYCVHQSLD